MITLALPAVAGPLPGTRCGTPRSRGCWPAKPRPRKPFIVMNPPGPAVGRSLGSTGPARPGRWVRRSRCWTVPGWVDVAAIVRDAVAGGADLLVVAGGDGTQAPVAGIAAEHDLPLLVISPDTRNHVALDLGLDRDESSTCLQALIDGEEVRVDLGMIADRPVVNNASFGPTPRACSARNIPGQQEPHHAVDAAGPAR